MKMPGAEKAVVDEAKVRDYLLAFKHPVGRWKAQFFASLGFRADNWRDLQQTNRRFKYPASEVFAMSVQYSRRPFTVSEYDQMVETGILREDDRVELIEGEIVAMGPIGNRHAPAFAS